MKVMILCSIIFCCTVLCKAQSDLIIIKDINLADGSIGIEVSNKSFAPVSIELKGKIVNANTSAKLPYTVCVAANTVTNVLQITPNKNGKAWSYDYTYKWVWGNTLIAQPIDTAYVLPFKTANCIKVFQGYFGQFSHMGRKALDFSLTEGTPIVAARDGIVIDTKDDSNTGCADISCQSMANYVKILHSDGTIAYYAHLQYKGVSVKNGAAIKAGTVIGLSGNTGFSSGPHLHFEVILPNMNNAMGQSIGTKFILQNNPVGKELQQGECVQ